MLLRAKLLIVAAIFLIQCCLAALKGSVDAARLPSMEGPSLTEEGEEIDHGVVRGKILMEQAKMGDFSAAEDILLAGATELFDHETGNTPLLYAIYHDDVDATLMLIEHGFDLFHVNHDGHNCLHVAALRDNEDMITHLLEYFLHDDDVQVYYLALDSLEIDGKLSVNVAKAIIELSIMHEDIGLIMHAIGRGVSVHTRSETGYTPLMLAVRMEDEVAVEEVLRYGGDPNDAENDGWYNNNCSCPTCDIRYLGLLLCLPLI